MMLSFTIRRQYQKVWAMYIEKFQYTFQMRLCYN